MVVDCSSVGSKRKKEIKVIKLKRVKDVFGFIEGGS